MNVDLRCGDCLTMTFPPNAAIVTDPPYGMRNNCDYTRFSGGQPGSIAKRGMGRDYKSDIVGDDAPFDPSPWLNFPYVILFGCNHFAARLPVGTTLVWIKRNDAAFGSFLSDAELAWMKGGHGVYCRRDLSMNAITRERAHPTQKPVALMRWCIERLHLPASTVIVDPYMGSGSTGIAAIELGFDFIGVEIEPRYFEVAQRRIEHARTRPQQPRLEAIP